MEKQKSLRAVEILTALIREFIALASQISTERVLELYSNPGGIPSEIREILLETHERRIDLEDTLFRRMGEKFDATTLEMLVFCDEVIHFGLAIGYFEASVCDFLWKQLHQLDIAPYDSPEGAMRYIQTKLNEADPKGLWTVSTCTCNKCLGSSSPGIQIVTAHAVQYEEAIAVMMNEIASKNVLEAIGLRSNSAKYNVFSLKWMKRPEKKQ